MRGSAAARSAVCSKGNHAVARVLTLLSSRSFSHCSDGPTALHCDGHPCGARPAAPRVRAARCPPAVHGPSTPQRPPTPYSRAQLSHRTFRWDASDNGNFMNASTECGYFESACG